MGKQAVGAEDLSTNKVEAVLAAVGQTVGPGVGFQGMFNVTVSGTFVGAVVFERSFDGGATWLAVSTDAYGTAMSFSAPASVVLHEPEPGVLYQGRMTAWNSGGAACRISR